MQNLVKIVEELFALNFVENFYACIHTAFKVCFCYTIAGINDDTKRKKKCSPNPVWNRCQKIHHLLQYIEQVSSLHKILFLQRHSRQPRRQKTLSRVKNEENPSTPHHEKSDSNEARSFIEHP